MPEYVVQADPSGMVRGQAGLGRAAAILDRLPKRSGQPRDMDAGFALLAALRGREPVGRVRAHVCRHDQGITDCSSAVVEA